MVHFCTYKFKGYTYTCKLFQNVPFNWEKTKLLPLSTSHLQSPSRYSFLCHPSSVSARVCRSPGSPRSAGQHNTDKPSVPAQKRPPGWDFFYWFLHADHTNPCLPVVGGRLLKRLVKLELDFSSFEGALRLHAYNPLVVHGHYQVGLGAIPHLPDCKTHTCRTGRVKSQICIRYNTLKGQMYDWNLV